MWELDSNTFINLDIKTLIYNIGHIELLWYRYMIYTSRYKENKNPVNKLAIFSYTCFIWIEVKRYQDFIYQYIRIPNDMFLYI